jgi:hypothetical protein
VDFSSGPPLMPTYRPPVWVAGPDQLLDWQVSDYVLGDPGDPGSPLRQVTLKLVLDSLDANEVLGGIQILPGDGESGSPSLAVEHSSHFEIDTSAALFVFPKNGALWSQGWSGPQPVVGPGAASGLYVLTTAGATYSSRWGSSSSQLQANGPAFAALQFTGSLMDAQGVQSWGSYTLTFSTFAGAETLRAELQIEPLPGSADVLSTFFVTHASQAAGGVAFSSDQRILQDHSLAEGGAAASLGAGVPQPYHVHSVTQIPTGAAVTFVSRLPADQQALSYEQGSDWLALQLDVVEDREALLKSEFSVSVQQLAPVDLQQFASQQIYPAIGETLP